MPLLSTCRPKDSASSDTRKDSSSCSFSLSHSFLSSRTRARAAWCGFSPVRLQAFAVSPARNKNTKELKDEQGKVWAVCAGCCCGGFFVVFERLLAYR